MSSVICLAKTATETTSEDSSELDVSTTPAVEEGAAIRTAYVSRVSKTADVAAVKNLASALPGVRNVRVPVRGGGHMGYMFVECEDGEGMRGVIEALNGMEFNGNALVAERAKEDPKPKKRKASANADKKKTTENKSNKKTKEKGKSRAEIVAEAKERKLMDARAQMPGERGSSTSRRRTDLRSVCGRLTTDRRRHKVHIRSRTERPPALARTMCMY